MNRSLTIVGLGEALFDQFPDESLLGGAPLNVAAMASQLLSCNGSAGVPASRIGNDPLGERIRIELAERNVETDYLQTDSIHATGQVIVDIVDGDPRYEIVQEVAWDYLEWTESWQKLAKECAAVCFDTLAQRNEISRQTIQSFIITATQAIRLFDVNLRQDYYSEEVIWESLQKASVAKMNEHELPIVHRLVSTESASVDESAQRLREQFSLDAVVLTHGSKGTSLYIDGDRTAAEPVCYPPHKRADSVGAGDACAAAILTGLLLDWPPERTASLANHVGAFVASQPGATPTLPESLCSLFVTK